MVMLTQMLMIVGNHVSNHPILVPNFGSYPWHCVCVRVHPSYIGHGNLNHQPKLTLKEKGHGAQGHSRRLGPTKALPVCRANVPATDALGRSGRSWWSQIQTYRYINNKHSYVCRESWFHASTALLPSGLDTHGAYDATSTRSSRNCRESSTR